MKFPNEFTEKTDEIQDGEYLMIGKQNELPKKISAKKIGSALQKGDGIIINNNVISVDTNIIATKQYVDDVLLAIENREY